MVAASASVILFTVIPSVFTLIFSGFMCLVAYDLSKVSDHFSKAADDALSDFHVQWKRLTHQQSAIVIHFTEGTIVLGPLLRTLSVFSDSNDIF
ncbi:MAG: hypothetical protein A3D96_01920 [Chlamydiae bacterium RIFCSPHIGHO2_12_FULL_44_59]|nr:MAG: hypothetical protein A2796_04610 [Chlamydiae bacterium RIFCSPHIGHO2_01_FULL_44_39]OGN59301.1 MAG: hypothetical protein A3C42_04890 [Chlamydiae bacterium RIFCSPHIGHO2_02_FULL_45_9]OGN60667.1 MAG: hypothetical protein A3D96_01920 [Chlamydiae bacterium RIFCSPHIGHO2_12_FULL_44_59]OGN66927.1 MAG: hypothetical protein A2978_02150 [Chlamydiae bacterium RIFCSPLOWO2_01_FULL_44_52]OGN67479.1 MAG: hypothetical protein A3I67_03365 [Chlamydiae bacterium RIFCSPLOWO2_02_FULL_45_22]OGN71180.1 MAG: hyp